MKTAEKRIVSTSFAMVVALSLAGCGNAIPAINEKNSGMISEEVAEMVEDDTSLEEIIADAGEPVEQSVEADKTAEQTAEPAAPTPAPTPAATSTPEPVHEHSWKEHVATTQTWIPKIVVVDDYETRYVEVGSHEEDQGHILRP